MRSLRYKRTDYDRSGELREFDSVVRDVVLRSPRVASLADVVALVAEDWGDGRERNTRSRGGRRAKPATQTARQRHQAMTQRVRRSLRRAVARDLLARTVKLHEIHEDILDGGYVYGSAAVVARYVRRNQYTTAELVGAFVQMAKEPLITYWDKRRSKRQKAA